MAKTVSKGIHLSNSVQLLIGIGLFVFAVGVFSYAAYDVKMLAIPAGIAFMMALYFFSNLKYMAIGIALGIFAVGYSFAVFLYDSILWPSC